MLLSMKHVLLFSTLLLCTACGGAELRESLGLNRRAPDEFRVVSRPSLSVPREFYLYPPDEAAEHGVADNTTDKARAALLGTPKDDAYLERYKHEPKRTSGTADTAVPEVNAGALPSVGEEGFLGKLGANKGDPNIRSELKSETTAIEKKGKEASLLDSLTPEMSEPQVDAAKERTRLRENKKKNAPVNKGEVPVITPKNSVLGKWF
jgi:Protein of unknown function (DUF3035)